MTAAHNGGGDSRDDWTNSRSAEEIAEEIGAEPAGEADKGHRRAHNLGALRMEGKAS